MILIKQKSDLIGTCTSFLCLVHCIATPFLFLAQTGSAVFSGGAPSWWRFLDYFFLVVSFAAIYRSTTTTSIKWMKPLMWISWLVLFLVIINEKLELFHLAEAAIYVPAFALIALHLYNRKYCECNTDTCCANE